MKTAILSLATIIALSVPVLAQVPSTRVMVCNKILWVFTTKCTYINKPKPVAKKPRIRIDITKPGNYNNMSAQERAIIDAK